MATTTLTTSAPAEITTIHAPSTATTLLSLPAEIRQQIFTHVLAGTSAANPSDNENPQPRDLYPSPHTPGSLSLLRTCRLVHADAKLLAIQLNTLHFAPWFGSSVPLAFRVLNKMTAWQRGALRRVYLKLTAADLGPCGRAGELCGLLASSAGPDTAEPEAGLKELSLTISNVGGFSCFPAAGTLGGLLSVDQDWVRGGILKLRSLRSLRIVVDARTMWGKLGRFEGELRDQMRWVGREGDGVVVREMKEDRELDGEIMRIL